MPKRSERLKAKDKEGDSDDDAGIERIGTVELRNCVIAAPIRRQAAQEPTPGAAAAAEPATACTHAPVSQTAVLKFEATDDLSCSINLGPVEDFKKKLGPVISIGEDVALWSTAVDAVLQRMRQMHLTLDLEDLRKTI